MTTIKKQSVVIFTTIFSALIAVFPVHAVISDTTAGAISMSCNSIRFTMKDLQKSDATMRVYLGSTYERILTDFITNLNLRLIKNSQAPTDLTTLQSTFSSERDFFSRIFIDYSKSLEDLVAYDCKSDPYGFYDRLETTREKREEVRASFLRLRDVLGDYRTAVEDLRSSL
jgi:hypothetical protein